MLTVLFSAYALAHLAMFVWLLRMLRAGATPGAAIVALVAAGLTYDNGMIALGSAIGIGPLLETLSWPRFALHAAFTPFIMVAAWQMARAAGIAWALNARACAVLWLLVAAMVAYGVFFDLLGLDVQPACLGDTLRYSSSTPAPQFCSPDQVQLPGHGPPVPSIVTVIICLIVGGGLWRRAGWPWLFAAALAMFIAAGIPQSQTGPVFGNGGEVMLQAGFTITAWRIRQWGAETGA